MRKTTVVSKIEIFGPTNPHLVEDVITRKIKILVSVCTLRRLVCVLRNDLDILKINGERIFSLNP